MYCIYIPVVLWARLLLNSTKNFSVVVSKDGDATRAAVINQYKNSDNSILTFLGDPSSCGNTTFLHFSLRHYTYMFNISIRMNLAAIYFSSEFHKFPFNYRFYGCNK